MEYKIYKLVFQSAVHFGNGTLESSEYTFSADTLFSALCIEALKQGQEVLDEFVQAVKNGNLCFSDAFPFMGKTCFLPKPMLRINAETASGDSIVKKAFKKLKYIPVEDMEQFIAGKYDVLHAKSLKDLGYHDMKVSVSIRGNEETEPYRVGIYYFNKGNGLYIITGYEKEEDSYLLEDLLQSLSYSGIGGKRNSGYGRFELYAGKMDEALLRMLKEDGDRYILLSCALPAENELEDVLPGARYLLSKRSGFVASDSYAECQMKKKDLFVFCSGSCFCKRFSGDVYDVSASAGTHAVYRYAKPLFLGVKV